MIILIGNLLTLLPQSLHSSLINQMPSIHPLYYVCVFYRGGCIINPIQSSSLRFFLSIVSLWFTAHGQFILSSILNGPFVSLIIITALMDRFPFQNIPLSWANLIKLHYSIVSLLPTGHHAGLPFPQKNVFLSQWRSFFFFEKHGASLGENLRRARLVIGKVVTRERQERTMERNKYCSCQ